MNLDPSRRIVVATIGPWRIGFRLGAVLQVIRAVEITPLPEALPGVLGVIDVRGTVVPVLSIRERFGCPPEAVTPSDQFILARVGDRQCALVVDEVRSVVDVAPDMLTPSEQVVPELETLEGVAQLADGLVLVEDLDRFLSPEEQQALADSLDGANEH